MKTRNLIRLHQSSIDKASLVIEVCTSPGHYTVYGNMEYIRSTGDLSVKWCFDCPLSRLDRLREILRFVRFLISL